MNAERKNLYLSVTIISIMVMIVGGVCVLKAPSSLAWDYFSFTVVPTASDGIEVIHNCELTVSPECQNPPSIVIQANEDGTFTVSTIDFTWDPEQFPTTNFEIVDVTGLYQYAINTYTLTTGSAGTTFYSCGTLSASGENQQYTCSEIQDSTTYCPHGEGLPSSFNYIGTQGSITFDMFAAAHLSDKGMKTSYPNSNYVKMEVRNVHFHAYQRTPPITSWTEVFGSPKTHFGTDLYVDIRDTYYVDDHWDPHLQITFTRTSMPVTDKYKFVLELDWDIYVSQDGLNWGASVNGNSESQTYYVN